MLSFRVCLTNVIKSSNRVNLISLDGFEEAWLG